MNNPLAQYSIDDTAESSYEEWKRKYVDNSERRHTVSNITSAPQSSMSRRSLSLMLPRRFTTQMITSTGSQRKVLPPPPLSDLVNAPWNRPSEPNILQGTITRIITRPSLGKRIANAVQISAAAALAADLAVGTMEESVPLRILRFEKSLQEKMQ